MPRLKFGTARLSVLRSRYSPPERSEGPSGVAAARALFANCEPPTRRPPAAPEAPSRTTITTRSVELGPMPFWRRRGRIRFYHPPCPAMSVRAGASLELEGKSAGAATRAARPENVSWAQFYHEFPGMTLPDDPASGHAHTCRRPSEIKVTPPMMLSAPPTPHEPPFAGSARFEVLRHSLHVPFGQPRHTPPP